jgi:hypothetical protein
MGERLTTGSSRFRDRRPSVGDKAWPSAANCDYRPTILACGGWFQVDPPVRSNRNRPRFARKEIAPPGRAPGPRAAGGYDVGVRRRARAYAVSENCAFSCSSVLSRAYDLIPAGIPGNMATPANRDVRLILG